MRITLLGTGTSSGVPMIGCACATCLSSDPRDRRSRPSILLELADGTQVLVDTSTDLRTQALTCEIARVDAVLFTHSHADHVCGLDDVRRYNHLQRAPIPVYGDAQTLDDLRRMFSYAFVPPRLYHAGGTPRLAGFTVLGPFSLGPSVVVPVPVWHGRRLILGFRVGRFAYLTDCSAIPDSSWSLLDGVEVLVIDALRHRPHPTHFSVSEALEATARIGPRRAYLTHICHDLPHAATCAALPEHVDLAYDGQVIELPDDVE